MPPSATNCCYSTIFRYTANVSHLTAACIETPIIKLSDVNWHVKLCKKSTVEGTEALGIYLVSSFSDTTMKWSCEAKAAFKLLPKDPQGDKIIVKYLTKHEFGDTSSAHGIDEFIDWTEFLENYVDETKAHFEMEISTNPLKRMLISDLEQTYCKLRVTVEKIGELTKFYSPSVIVRGIKWQLYIKKYKDGDDEFLAVFLSAVTTNQNWSYPVTATFKLLTFNESAPVKKDTRHKFTFEEFDWGFFKFISWSNFTRGNRFICKDRAKFEVVFNVDEPKPSWEIDRYRLSAANSSLQCTVCLDCFSSGQIYSTKCGHLFCLSCSTKSINGNNVCPMCKAPTKSADIHPIYFT